MFGSQKGWPDGWGWLLRLRKKAKVKNRGKKSRGQEKSWLAIGTDVKGIWEMGLGKGKEKIWDSSLKDTEEGWAKSKSDLRW